MLIVPANVRSFTISGTVKSYGPVNVKSLELFFDTDVLQKRFVARIWPASRTSTAVEAVVSKQETIFNAVLIDANNVTYINSKEQTINSVQESRIATSFSSLSHFDSNHDGLIDLRDPKWQKLGIWRDANGDGVFQKDEIQTLDKAGIAAIDLRSGAASVSDSLGKGLLPVLMNDGSASFLAVNPSRAS